MLREAVREQLTGVVDFWLIDLKQVTKADDYYAHLLDPHEAGVVAKMRLPLLRQRYLQIHGLVREILAQYLFDTHPRDIVIARTAWGKPYLPACAALSFNLSHTDSWGLLGVTYQSALGVDIEQVVLKRQLGGLVQKCFAQREQAYWLSLSPEQQVEVFYAFWTRKEALVKAVGRGIALGLECCELDVMDWARFLVVPEMCGASHTWQVIDVQCQAGFKAAIVVQGEDVRLRQRMDWVK